MGTRRMISSPSTTRWWPIPNEALPQTTSSDHRGRGRILPRTVSTLTLPGRRNHEVQDNSVLYGCFDYDYDHDHDRGKAPAKFDSFPKIAAARGSARSSPACRGCRHHTRPPWRRRHRASEIRADLVTADADLLCSGANQTWVRWVVDYSVPGAAYPRVRRRTEDPEDLTSRAERERKIFDMSFRPTLAQVKDTYGGDREPVTQEPPSPKGKRPPWDRRLPAGPPGERQRCRVSRPITHRGPRRPAHWERRL